MPLPHLRDKAYTSPAKVNLFFRVLRKRDDGYHEIATKMQAISLFDTITFQESDRDSFTCSDPSLPIDETNLVLRAKALFHALTGIVTPFHITLTKRIPAQAGLGGGSGNAATTLFALNELCGHPLSLEALQQASASLGADVPFFFSQGTAYCTGIGEHIHPEPFEESRCVIVKPPYGVPTAGVYKACRPHACSSKPPEVLLQTGELVNDLEYPAFQARPALAAVKQSLLEAGFERVVMTGSGSSFLCFGQPHKPLPRTLQTFPALFLQRKSGEWYA